MEKKRQRKLNNLRYRLRKNGYQINDEVKVVVLREWKKSEAFYENEK